MKKITLLPLLTAVVFLLNYNPGFAQLAAPSTPQNLPTIAILPCNVDHLGIAKSAIPSDELQYLEHSIAYSIQQEMFQELHDYIDARYPDEIRIQQLAETNTRLQLNQISLQDSWELGLYELAAILEVDAVLMVRVRYDRGAVTRTSGTSDNLGAPRCDDGFTPTPSSIRYHAALREVQTGYALSGFGRCFGLKRGKKHDLLAKRIVRRIGSGLSSLFYDYAQNDMD